VVKNLAAVLVLTIRHDAIIELSQSEAITDTIMSIAGNIDCGRYKLRRPEPFGGNLSAAGEFDRKRLAKRATGTTAATGTWSILARVSRTEGRF
jgi:hypothetical protein